MAEVGALNTIPESFTESEQIVRRTLLYFRCGLAGYCFLIVRLQLPCDDVVLTTLNGDKFDWYAIEFIPELQTRQVWVLELNVMLSLEVLSHVYPTIGIMCKETRTGRLSSHTFQVFPFANTGEPQVNLR